MVLSGHEGWAPAGQVRDRGLAHYSWGPQPELCPQEAFMFATLWRACRL